MLFVIQLKTVLVLVRLKIPEKKLSFGNDENGDGNDLCSVHCEACGE